MPMYLHCSLVVLSAVIALTREGIVLWDCLFLPLQAIKTCMRNLGKSFSQSQLSCTLPPLEEAAVGFLISVLAPSGCNVVTPGGSQLFGVLFLEPEVSRCRLAQVATGSSPGPSSSSPSLSTLCHLVHFQDVFGLINLMKT